MCWADRLLNQLPLHLGVASDKRELLVGASRKNLNKEMTHLGAGLPFPAWNTDMNSNSHFITLSKKMEGALISDEFMELPYQP